MREDILIQNTSKSLSKILHPALRIPATEKCHHIRSFSPAFLIHTKTCVILRSFCLIDALVQKMLMSIHIYSSNWNTFWMLYTLKNTSKINMFMPMPKSRMLLLFEHPFYLWSSISKQIQQSCWEEWYDCLDI